MPMTQLSMSVYKKREIFTKKLDFFVHTFRKPMGLTGSCVGSVTTAGPPTNSLAVNILLQMLAAGQRDGGKA